jgi:hypothetical protein
MPLAEEASMKSFHSKWSPVAFSEEVSAVK